MESSLEVRLQYLEAREKANTKEIVGLKTENAELQTKVFDLKRQNLQAAEKMMEMETCCEKMMEMETCYKKMENDLKSIFGFRDIIENQLTHLESNMTGFTDNHDRLSNLETDINQAKLEMTNHCQSLTQKVETFEREGGQPKSQLEGACAVPDTLDFVRQEQAMQGVGVTDRLDVLERQASEILNKVQRLDEIRNQISQSVTCVSVKPSQRLKTGQFSKLDECCNVFINGGCFDTGSCCFDPHVAGDYLVSVLYRQANDGEIQVNAVADDNSGRECIGRTAQHNELSECFDIIRLARGRRLWLKAKLCEGNAYINCCNFRCWLLHPITT